MRIGPSPFVLQDIPLRQRPPVPYRSDDSRVEVVSTGDVADKETLLLTQSRRQPPNAHPEPAPPPEATPPSAAAETSPLPLEKRMLKAINATLTEALQVLLDDILLRAYSGEGASISTRGTIQHSADADHTYIFDYEVQVAYRRVEKKPPEEGKPES